MLALFRSLPDLPAVPELRYTAAMTISDYADWLGATLRGGKGQDVLPILLQLLVQGEASEPPQLQPVWASSGSQ